MSAMDHGPIVDSDSCMYCLETWPCQTARIRHELAEVIRNSDELRDLTDDHMADCNAAADLIDVKRWTL